MTAHGERSPGRPSLSRERVLEAAIAVADTRGIAALTIRSLAQHLGVKPMSLYHYVANKSEILDAIVDVVLARSSCPRWTGTGEPRSVSGPRRLDTFCDGTPGPSVSSSPAPHRDRPLCVTTTR